MSETSTVRVGLLGCGTVGGALVALMREQAGEIAERTGVRLEISRVAVRSASKDRSVTISPAVLTTDPASVVSARDVDVVVELIGGIEPAFDLILDALKEGKPVVTANKELIANLGAELYAAASSSGVDLLFEASTAGAIPLVRVLRESLVGEHVTRVMGIVNGTTNYVLTRMTEAGVSYAEALTEAQNLGFAERDPAADVEGYDAAAKAAIIASIVFGTRVVAGDVYREGITTITADDISYATRLGFVVKLLAIAERSESVDGGPDEVNVRVHPAMVPSDHPLASVRDSFNAVFVEGDACDQMMLYGRGAGGRPTASAVLGDLVDAAINLRQGTHRPFVAPERRRIRTIDDLRTEYCINLDVVDEPGVLASVAGVFGAHGVSIRSMEQLGLQHEARLIFITHTAREADVQATIAGLRSLGAVDSVNSVLRVVGDED
ncbi:MAG TPA: homoserine dehydrogenase [Acidimicrobiales bacterium]